MAAARELVFSSTAGRLKLALHFSPSSIRPCYTRGICTTSLGPAKRTNSTVEEPEEHVNPAARELGVTRYYCNRNPRSLELLGMAVKPKGFETAYRRVDYYHRLIFFPSSRHSSAYINHNNGTKVIEASTTELCIARHLHKTSDVTAAYNIGRVVARRCKEMGLNRVMWEHKSDRKHERVKAFLRGVQEQGLVLNEPKVRTLLPPPGSLPK